MSSIYSFRDGPMRGGWGNWLVRGRAGRVSSPERRSASPERERIDTAGGAGELVRELPGAEPAHSQSVTPQEARPELSTNWHLRLGARRSCSTAPVLTPVLREPPDLLISQCELKSFAMKARVLRVRRQLVSDIDPKPRRLNG